MRKIKKFNLTIVSVFLFILNTVSAEEKNLVLGGKDGWKKLSKMDGIVCGKGKFGYDAMVLATNSRPQDDYTDILINFENNKVRDVTGNYQVTSNKIIPSPDSMMGEFSGLVRGHDGVSLQGNSHSLFGKSGATGSFLIEFWLKPSIAENGEIVFSWRSSRTVSNYPLYQIINASFSGNHLEWSFTNVFNGYVDNSGEITLSSYRTIIPETWMHHSISFDQDTGLLEYRINGLLESLKYITTTGHEDMGSIYMPLLGVPANIEICPQYSGMIDDFRIQRNTKSETAEKLKYSAYRTDGGRFETEPILLSQGTSIKRIDALVTKPAQTDVEFFVRSGDNFYNWTDKKPAWIPIKNHEEIKNVSGLYFQIAANLYPDGNGKVSPSITEIKVNYEDVPLPLPPFDLKAKAENGAVTLTWPYSVDESVGGYYIFYGEKPGEYLGKCAIEGDSPIEVGNTTSTRITGLKNGRLYYFAIASYSRFDTKVTGDLSKEVFARPMDR